MSSSLSPPPLSLFGAQATATMETAATDYDPPLTRHASSFGNISPSILIIVLILAVTIVASVSLCFLLRHLNRRCLRHLSATASSSSSSTFSSSSGIGVGESRRISSRRVSPENPKDSAIDALPLFPFSSVTRRRDDSSSAAADCAVCLSKFEPEDQLRLLPLCCHAFHALCVDTWLRSNQTCPLCRSPIFACEAEILKKLGGDCESRCDGESFRIEIGNVSRRETTPRDAANDAVLAVNSRSFSIGSFDYLVEDESEIVLSTVATHRRNASSEYKDENRRDFLPATVTESSLASDVASSGRTSWLRDYVDRLSMSFSSRAASFRSSGRFFTGSSRRSDVVLGGVEWDLEASRVGEEISELFRWVSGV